MLDRIVVDVIYMSIHVFLIPDDVVPESGLPDRAAILAVLTVKLVGEGQFHASQNPRQVFVLRIDDHMEMLRQHDPGDDFKVRAVRGTLYRLPEQGEVLDQERHSSVRDRSHEVYTARCIVAEQFGHDSE